VNTIRFFYIFILVSSFTSSIISAQIQENLLHKKNIVHAQEWVHYYIEQLEPQQVQIVANILYLLYANALIDIKIRQFTIPITRLNQSVRSNITNYKNTSKDLATLKTLLDRLSHVIGARTIYNQKLSTCLEYYNKNPLLRLTQAIVELQTYGQNSLNEFVELNYSEISQLLKSSSEIFNAGIQSLQSISTIHSNIANGSILESLKNNEATQKFAALISFDELLKNNVIAIQNTEHILNTLDESTELIQQLISSAIDIYKYHYEALYQYISSPSFDQTYARTLFGMNDLLPDEYKSSLPHPNNVFEHVLQTIKLYTQIELIQ